MFMIAPQYKSLLRQQSCELMLTLLRNKCAETSLDEAFLNLRRKEKAIYIYIYIYIYRERERERERERDRQTDRQTDRHADRQRQAETETGRDRRPNFPSHPAKLKKIEQN